MISIARVCEDLEADEGFRSTVYRDSEGYWTVGFGICVDDRVAGAGLTEDEARSILNKRVRRTYFDIHRAIPYIDDLPEPVQRAMVNMAYQLGVKGLLQFKKMLLALDVRDYAMAAEEALDSKWAQQTPNRAKRIADLIRSA